MEYPLTVSLLNATGCSENLLFSEDNTKAQRTSEHLFGITAPLELLSNKKGGFFNSWNEL